MRTLKLSVAALVAALSPAPASPQSPIPNPVLSDQVSGTTSLLQAVSVVNERVVWVSGHKATYVRTIDGGKTWHAATMPGDSTLQFRDVYAVDEHTAYLMSSGTGRASRIYITGDAGKTWKLQYTNPDSAGFYDCMDFWDRDHGLVYGDEVNGETVVLATTDGGANWGRLPAEMLPIPPKGEGGYAASGTCLVVANPAFAWIGTGAGGLARVFRSVNRGAVWTVAETPVFHGSKASGIQSLAFRDSLNGMAFGGDLGDAASHTDNVAATFDGGKTWHLTGRPIMSGAIYGSSWVAGAPRPTVVIVSPKGAEVSTDNGADWTSISSNAYWAVGFASNGVGWMVGPGGRITRVSLGR